MALEFPLNPAIGDQYALGAITWRWDGARWRVIRTFSAADSQAIASTVNTLLSTIQTESQQITDNFISESAQAQATINNAISSIANAVEIKGTLGFTIPAEHYTDLIFTTPDFFYEIADLDGENPPLTLIRGETYTFNFEGVSETHPIALRLSADDQTEVPGATGNDSINGVQGTGAIVTYIVPLDAPNSIVYQCAVHQTMIGLITIVDEIIYPTIHTLPTTYGVGWMYSVIEAGIVAGHTVEVGDMIMAMVERNGTDNLNSDWTVLQANIDTSASEALAIAYAIAL